MLCGFWRKHALFLMLFILVFCNRATAETVKDAAGRDVVVPEKVERIAITCYGGTTHDICVMGAEDRIVAQPSMKAFPQLLKFFPRLKEVSHERDKLPRYGKSHVASPRRFRGHELWYSHSCKKYS